MEDGLISPSLTTRGREAPQEPYCPATTPVEKAGPGTPTCFEVLGSIDPRRQTWIPWDPGTCVSICTAGCLALLPDSGPVNCSLCLLLSLTMCLSN